jgi:GT2 family glycosyltransferase
MKNIGFLYAKEKYTYYKDIVFVFNDLDTLPYKKGLLDYTLNQNEIKHYYGFTFCLGGIFAIRGSDFERINGFPSFWNWGWEDTVLYDRAIAANIKINREQFYDYGSSSILHLIDGVKKEISTRTNDLYTRGIVLDGLSTLRNLYYIKEDMLDVYMFTCMYLPIVDDAMITASLPHRKPPIHTKKREFKMFYL